MMRDGGVGVAIDNGVDGGCHCDKVLSTVNKTTIECYKLCAVCALHTCRMVGGYRPRK
jgi:hypothetical protein